MEKTILGRTGLEVTKAGLGCGGFSRLGMFSKGIDNAVEIVRCAYDAGINFFDTAYAYGTQPAVGKALEGLPRDSYVISTKFQYSDKGIIKPAQSLERDLDESLKDLKTDHVEIYHLHGVRPSDYPEVRDRFYPELVKMKEKGKIRAFGLTEMFGADTSHEALKPALVDNLWDVIMVGYNMLNPSAAKAILPAARKLNVGTLCMFAVRTSLSNPEQLKVDVKKMLELGQADKKLVPEEKTLDFLVDDGYADSIMEAAYRFCRHTHGIDVTLTGTGDKEHLKANLKSLSKPPLPDEILDRLEQLFGRVDCISGQQSFPGM